MNECTKVDKIWMRTNLLIKYFHIFFLIYAVVYKNCLQKYILQRFDATKRNFVAICYYIWSFSDCIYKHLHHVSMLYIVSYSQIACQ